MLQQFAEGVATKMQAVIKDLEKKRKKKKEPGTDRSVFSYNYLHLLTTRTHMQ